MPVPTGKYFAFVAPLLLRRFFRFIAPYSKALAYDFSRREIFIYGSSMLSSILTCHMMPRDAAMGRFQLASRMATPIDSDAGLLHQYLPFMSADARQHASPPAQRAIHHEQHDARFLRRRQRRSRHARLRYNARRHRSTAHRTAQCAFRFHALSIYVMSLVFFSRAIAHIRASCDKPNTRDFSCQASTSLSQAHTFKASFHGSSHYHAIVGQMPLK